MRKVAALLLLTVASTLVACGDDASDGAVTADSSVRGSPQLRLEADPDGDLAYTADHAFGSPGNIAFVVENPTPTPHTVAIEDERGNQLGRTTAAINGSTSVTITMDAGEYVFYCAVTGHRKAGMEGTLTVG